MGTLTSWGTCAVIALSVCGCSSDDGSGATTFGSGDPSAGVGSATADGSSSGASGEGTSGGTTTDGAGTAGTRFDTPDGAEGPGDEDKGCKKVDFLFVIDNSGSMGDEQDNLARSFPGFIDHIDQTLEARDFQIMVVDPDRWFCDNCNQTSCSPAPQCCDCAPGLICNGAACPEPPPPTACDELLGAGKTVDQFGIECPITSGTRFLRDGQTDLNATFECLAVVGTQGDANEKTMESMVVAAGPSFNAMGGCNEGFVRPDAILVVTVITDEEDSAGKSAGNPASWKQALVDAKAGNEDAVIVLGLIPDMAPRLHEFVGLFPTTGVVGSVDEPDYTPFFVDAVSVIDAACDEFVPPEG